ncbi:MAG: hypothetical protein N3B17_01365 [Chlorobi bacterium]|nr:hypothetical protein [Chlorobiota bacterium]
MRRHLLSSVMVAAVGLLFHHCTDSTSSPTPSVELYADMNTSTVRQAALLDKGTAAQGITAVDSIKIERVRILVRRLKLHGSDSDSSGKDLKTDPFIVTFTAQQQRVTSATIPTGTYRWMKLEFHRLSNDEADRLYNNPAFADFIPPERYSVIIEGKVYTRGSTVPDSFTYRSTVTANVALKLDPPAEVTANSVLGLVMRFDPAAVFTTNSGIVLHPLDPDSRSIIEGNIRAALKALKR